MIVNDLVIAKCTRGTYQGTIKSTSLGTYDVNILEVVEYPSQGRKIQKPYGFNQVVKLSEDELLSMGDNSDFMSQYTMENYLKTVISAIRSKLNEYGLINHDEKIILMTHLMEYRSLLEIERG